MPYNTLMSPGVIGGLELRNRILMTPMGPLSKRSAHSKGQKSASVTPLPSAASAFVQLATVLRGAQPLAQDEKGINDSFRGQLMLGDGTTRAAIIKDLDPKQLANELMVAVLAHAAGLPIPVAHLAMVLPGAMIANKGPTLLDPCAAKRVNTTREASAYR